jgi:hypothetical protein
VLGAGDRPHSKGRIAPSDSLLSAAVDALALVITGILLATVLLGVSGTARFLIMTAFTVFVPGWAVAGVAGTLTTVRRLALSVPVSLALTTAGTTVMALAHAWHPVLLLWAMAATSIASIVWARHSSLLDKARRAAILGRGIALALIGNSRLRQRPFGRAVASESITEVVVGLHVPIAVAVVTGVICVTPAVALVLVFAIQPVTALISLSFGIVIGHTLVKPHSLLSGRALLVVLGMATLLVASLRLAGLSEGGLSTDSLLTTIIDLWVPAALGAIAAAVSLPIARLARLRLSSAQE